MAHLMLLPTLQCLASCAYCFGPNTGTTLMPQSTLQAVTRWQEALADSAPLDITFHGGEPLLAGAPFYRIALPRLRAGFAPRKVRFSVQSNLWLLDDELCDVFGEHKVTLGSSLDGPEAINDAQRGAGYFQRTMAGIQRARTHGLDVACICTFTSRSAAHVRDVFDFFAREGLTFSMHPALPPVDAGAGNGRTRRNSDLWLSPQAHGELLVSLLETYLQSIDRVRVSTLDAMCRSVASGHGGLCTFGDCLGEHLAVGPDGDIYPCQRFTGLPEFRLGNVHNRPTQETLASSPAWQSFRHRQERVDYECRDCAYLSVCRGGCPYNALAANGGSFGTSARDPHCPAYMRAFAYITDRAVAEVFSESNLSSVVERGTGHRGLLHKGKLLQLMRGGPHPQQVARRARGVLAAVALASSASVAEAADRLQRAGIAAEPDAVADDVLAVEAKTRDQSRGLMNAYLHVTYSCNLSCTHCYALSGPGRDDALMSVEAVTALTREAARSGFAKVVITGGEPALHPQRDALLEALRRLRSEVKPMQTVLRTNLAYSLSPALLERLAHSTDQVVVSLDGDERAHDTRRGPGTYRQTVANLRALLDFKPSARITMTAVLGADEARSAPGDAVRALANELGVRARIKPVLPLGRAAARTRTAESLLPPCDLEGLVAGYAGPRVTCGLGMNVYVDPGGVCFPCYALVDGRYCLGNALERGLYETVHSGPFQALKGATVDTNRRCRGCVLRYLCGGQCRVWAQHDDLDAPCGQCDALRERARGLWLAAMDALDVSRERWEISGLPWLCLTVEGSSESGTQGGNPREVGNAIVVRTT